jgi:hypothetical protein
MPAAMEPAMEAAGMEPTAAEAAAMEAPTAEAAMKSAAMEPAAMTEAVSGANPSRKAVPIIWIGVVITIRQVVLAVTSVVYLTILREVRVVAINRRRWLWRRSP